MTMKRISVQNAHLHNLKNIDVELPTGKLIAISGVSGSGKSTLAFDILFETGRRSYLQALGVLASLGDEHGFDEIKGLMPTVAIKQGIIRRSNPRSVVGTKTRLLSYLATLYVDQHNRGTTIDNVLTPGQLSFNSPLGMCLSCQGRGTRFELDFQVLLPTPETTLLQVYKNALVDTTFRKRIIKIQEKLQLDPAAPFTSLPDSVQQLVLYGKSAHGISQISLFEVLRYKHTKGRPVNGAIKAKSCSDCNGYRISDEARSIRLNKKHIGQLGLMTIAELNEHLKKTSRILKTRKNSSGVGRLLIEKALDITDQLIAVKLDYLTAYRPVPSLSGGEMQRLFLMSHLRSDIAPLLYIFDEPTAGLHEVEKHELVERLKSLSKTGNTVIVVEHDPQTLQAADYIVDIGPLAGKDGGDVMHQGTVSGLKRCKKSLTGQHLLGSGPPQSRGSNRVVNRSTPMLVLSGVKTNNLKNITAKIPLEVLVGVTGLSGSGKSSLISDTLVTALTDFFIDIASQKSGKKSTKEKSHADSEDLNIVQATPVFGALTGAEKLDKCIEVSQAPIGRRSNSNVVSYPGIWDRIRRQYANTPQAQEAGLSAGHFSFNAAGACEQCRGAGQNQLWLGGSLVSYPCDQCNGQRYQDEILDIQFNGVSIADLLSTSVAEAKGLFSHDQTITRMLDVMTRTGMDYIALGQPTSTLSGGEAQRIKLAKELGRQRKGIRCLYILDEPTTGLSSYDINKLMVLLQELVEVGNSVIVVEHDPDVLSQCDWLLELGPAGGNLGGKIITTGTPDKLKKSKKSLIGAYLKQ